MYTKQQAVGAFLLICLSTSPGFAGSDVCNNKSGITDIVFTRGSLPGTNNIRVSWFFGPCEACLTECSTSFQLQVNSIVIEDRPLIVVNGPT